MKKVTYNTSLKFSSLKFLILLMLWMPFSYLWATEPALMPNACLAGYLELAARNNPGLKAAYENWQAARQVPSQVKALPNPSLSYSYFIRRVETRVGPQQHKIGMMQKFPWFGTLKLKGNAAEQEALAAKQQYENLKLNLFYRVKSAFYDYYYLAKSIGILNENLGLFQFLEEVVRSKYRTGSAEYSSLLKIQVELERLKDRLAGAKDGMAPVKARLNLAMNRVPGESLPHPPGDIPAFGPGVSYDTLSAQLKQNNPALKAAGAKTAGAQTGIQLAKKKGKPDFALGLDYLLTGHSSMPGVPDSGKDPVMAMVSIQLPIWGKKNKALVEAANARYRAAVNKSKEQENNLLERLQAVIYKYRDARRKAVLYKDSLLPRAQQAMEVSRSAFESGKINIMEFIDSQRILLMFQLDWEKSKSEQQKHLAELEMLTGGEVS